MTCLIGCDPGIRGGIASLKVSGGAPTRQCVTVTVALHRMPVMKGRGTRRVVDPAALASIIRPTGATHLHIEDVHSRPTDGVVQAFQFGENTGVVKGVAGALGLTISETLPQKWKATFGLTSDKGFSIHRAAMLCPTAAKIIGTHDGLAEAFLLGLYGLLSLGVKPQLIICNQGS